MTRRRGRRHDRKGRSKHEGQYFYLPYNMIRSAAFRSLNGATLKVFFELRARFNGSNNGKLHLSLEECADLLGMSKSTAQRAYVELEEKGFVIKTRQGLFHGGCASEWQVTDQKMDGAPATRDWEHWKPANATCTSVEKSSTRYSEEPMIAPIGPPEYRGPKKRPT